MDAARKKKRTMSLVPEALELIEIVRTCKWTSSTARPGWSPSPRTRAPPRTAGRTRQSGSGVFRFCSISGRKSEGFGEDVSAAMRKTDENV